MMSQIELEMFLFNPDSPCQLIIFSQRKKLWQVRDNSGQIQLHDRHAGSGQCGGHEETDG